MTVLHSNKLLFEYFSYLAWIWILTSESTSTCKSGNNEYTVHTISYLRYCIFCFVVTHTIVVVMIVVVAEEEPDRLICRLLSLSPLWVYHWVIKLVQLYRLNKILQYEAGNASNLPGYMITFLYNLYT